MGVKTLAGMAAAFIVMGATTAQAHWCDSANLKLTERVVCSDVRLRALDDQLNSRYRATEESLAVRGRGPELVAMLKKQQTAWILRRNRCGHNPDCIEVAYKERLAVLQGSRAAAVRKLDPKEGASWGGMVRSGPGMNYKQTGRLKEGDLVTLEKNTGVMMNGYPWFKIVHVNNQNGWSISGYQWGGILCAFDANPSVHKVCPVKWSDNPDRTGR